MTGPFHPDSDDESRSSATASSTRARVHGGEMSFTPAIRHIHRVIRGMEKPRHLAVDEASGERRAIGALLGSARSRA